jgi:hypothetical protein
MTRRWGKKQNGGQYYDFENIFLQKLSFQLNFPQFTNAKQFHGIGFRENWQYFAGKVTKIGQNSYHNIGPRVVHS